MIRETNLTQEEKENLEACLRRMNILPQRGCQVILHCVQGKIQMVEFSNFKIK